LEHTIRRLRIYSLKGQIAAVREQSSTLASKFEGASTSSEKTRIAQLYDNALKQAHTMQLLLELLEREALKEAVG
jgi:hypothetical protein